MIRTLTVAAVAAAVVLGGASTASARGSSWTSQPAGGVTLDGASLGQPRSATDSLVRDRRAADLDGRMWASAPVDARLR